ncbi:MAG: glycoside hydrolase family 127 protein [Proteobacteria bacterium]|nr:glycoside hydrolase family 127 protein [Pseudomonadota bacterium]
MHAPQAHKVTLGGLLGKALAANHTGRLSHFISDETSPAIAIFNPEQVSHNQEGDWYGEHAGKWLYAAAKAARRTGDEKLAASVRRVADYLIGLQDDDGYLGTYAPERRFMRKQPPGPRTWDGAPGKRTWDVWNHSCLVLGLLEVHKYFPDPGYLAAARRIGDLCWRTLTTGGINITELGLHHGMSATVLLDAAVDLHVATGERKYLDLATLILQQAEQRPELGLLRQALAGTDAAEISTGKAYQLCWNLVGLAKLYKATGHAQYLEAVQNLWNSIRQHHLTLGSGPWGGVGLRSREVFNHHSVFSPHGYVETCSILSWIQLNRELLAITGEARYAEEIESAAYNDLLGAQAPNGEDWCYYSFPNGKRVYTTYWRCCKSSGAMALEELPAIAYRVHAENILAINLYGPGEAMLPTSSAGMVGLEQSTRYPFEGSIKIVVKPDNPARFSILLRIPSWANGARIEVNGANWKGAAAPGSYAVLERDWRHGDVIDLQLPMSPTAHRKASRSVQESRDPYGESINQEVMRYDYIAITRGPLVYATGLIDGFKMQDTFRLAEGDVAGLLEVITPPPGYGGPAIRLNLDYRPPLVFHPYYETGGREDGTWRLTWLQVVPEASSA